MSDNRYAPPTAPVQDVPSSRRLGSRPREIVLAVQLAAAGYLLGMAVLVATWGYFSRLQSPGALIVNQAVSLLISVWLYVRVYEGKNWARITLLVLTLLGSLFAFGSAFMNVVAAAPMLSKIQMVAGLCINLIILWLLFISPGREWFKSGEE
jgi:hypothetical protein